VATRPAEVPETGSRLAFGPFVLDPETGRILAEGRVVPLAPKPFETLRYLASRSGRTISKAELMEKLWPDTFVTDDVLVQCVVDIRHALGDTAKAPRYVQTIPRRGYQFLAPVTVVDGSAPLAAMPVADPTPTASAPAAAPPPPRRIPPARAAAGVALVAVAVVAALFVVARFRRVEKQEVLEPGSLLVIPLSVEESAPQSGWLSEGLAEMIRSQLGQTPWIRVVARHRVAAALKDAGYSETVGPSPEAVGTIARRLHAERLVTGSFVRVEHRFVINAQVVDVATGRTEGTVSARGQGPSDLLDAVDDLCLKLVHTLAPGASAPGGPDFRPAPLTTRSVDASRQYVEALAWFARGGRLGAEQAETRLDEALKIDPSFAHAHLKKAEIQHWRSRWGYGDPDPAPAILAATRLMGELPERDRLLVASFEALIVRKQPADALRDWDSLLRLHPTYAEEVGVPSLAADTFLRLGRWDDLVTMGEAHVDSPSLPDAERALLASSLSRAYRRKGEFGRALQRARQAVRLWPSQNGPRFLRERAWLGRVSLEAGLRAEALAELRGVSVAPEADAVCLTTTAWGLYIAGETQEAAALVERALALDASFGNAYHLRGWMRLAQGEYATAAHDLETAFDRTPRDFGDTHVGAVSGDVAALYYSGVADLKLGHRADAFAAFDRVTALCRKVLLRGEGERGAAAAWQAANFLARAAARQGKDAPEPPRLVGDDTTYFVQSARLHAVQGRKAEALRELGQGLALGFGERRHIQDDPDFESLRADPEFQRLVTALLPG
jgi:DNA-binding winged helix-turn-helix (wHTH) protein/tetratricopeptide (TPR) repeat protein/TolB-like protein